MSQVSKKQIKDEIEATVFDSFWTVVAKLTKKEEVGMFFSDFFSKTERINFAKRVSIAVLLSKGYEYRSIRDILKVSTATILKVSLKMEHDGWKLFIRKLEQVEEWEKFWHDMELSLLRLTGGGKRMFKSDEELEVLVRGRKARMK
ncbi:hypothetical protein HYW40_02915 [Candidatus Curtissbacteria bacterium]|nr:hypothetical protein [Candidatus Curtissbacteria bacterium]